MASKTLLQKEIKKYVSSQLDASLIELKDLLGEKKFASRIKKATKILIDGLGKVKKENQGKEKAQVAEPTVSPAKKIIKKAATTKKAASTANKATEKAAPAKSTAKAK